MNEAVMEFIEEDSVGSAIEQLRKAGWLPEQGEDSDFASCLPALVLSLSSHVGMESLCEALPSKGTKIDIVEMLNTMSHMGYVGKPAKVRLCDIDERLLPCLFVPEKHDPEQRSSMVIMHKTAMDGGELELSVFYGGSEKTISVYADNKTRGIAYFFVKEEDNENVISQEVRTAAGFTWFRALLERFKGIFWQVFALSIVLGMVSLAAPLFIMLVYDRVIVNYSPETLTPLLMGAMLALFAEWSLRNLRSRSLSWFSARLDNIVSNKIFEQLMLMSPVFTERASVSSQIARLKAFETVRDFFTGSLFLALIELPFTLIILAAITIIAGPVVFVPIVTVLLYVGLLAWMRPKLKTAMKLSSKASANRQQMTVETFEKMDNLRASGITSSWFHQFRDLSGKSSLAGFNFGFLASVVETVSHSMFVLSGVVTIVIGIGLVWEEAMTTGALVASIILVWRVLTPFQILCNSLPRFEQLQNAIDQVNRLMEIKTERVEESKKAHVTEIKGQVTFSKVGLRYTKDTDPVFAGLSFDVKPGQIVAITGGNGSGKSTILKLVNGLYRPQAGTVRIDGVDIRQLDAVDLRKHIAYVPQSPHFFRGTIADNLRFAEPMVSDEMLQGVLMQVEAWEDVQKLPDGINTEIGEGAGGNLSSGLLAYRLSLARAYLKNTSLMLFDEMPYAFLNSPSGESYKEKLMEWKKYRTMFLVTHREDYLHMADVVVLLRQGETPIVGSYDEVIKIIEKSHEGV